MDKRTIQLFCRENEHGMWVAKNKKFDVHVEVDTMEEIFPYFDTFREEYFPKSADFDSVRLVFLFDLTR